MGSGASIQNDDNMQNVCLAFDNIGKEAKDEATFQNYKQLFQDNGIDEAKLISFKSKGEFVECIIGLGISNKLHIKILEDKFSDWSVKHKQMNRQASVTGADLNIDDLINKKLVKKDIFGERIKDNGIEISPSPNEEDKNAHDNDTSDVAQSLNKELSKVDLKISPGNVPSDTPPIRLINFSVFKELKEFPRLPDKNLTCVLEEVNLENSFIVFISHCWLRGWPGAEGYDKRPHPDNANHEKFQLCVVGIEKVRASMASDCSECFVWLDFGCINQNGNPAGELKQLDKIIECSDCIFTPIVDKQHDQWDMPASSSDFYRDYLAPAWIAPRHGYLDRGWCRVEMFYASNIPVGPVAKAKSTKFRHGMRSAVMDGQGRRPHFLFGRSRDVM